MKQRLKGGGEHDCASRKARRVCNPQKKGWSFYKKTMNKRFRKDAKIALNGEEVDI